jgi:hypothetical protein
MNLDSKAGDMPQFDPNDPREVVAIIIVSSDNLTNSSFIINCLPFPTSKIPFRDSDTFPSTWFKP